MRRLVVTLPLVAALAGCFQNGIPKDRSIEATFPAQPALQTMPRELRVVTFNVHGEPADVVARAIKRDRALRHADVIFLQEVHRIETPNAPACSTACGVGKELGFHAVYAPGHAIPEGSHGVAILSRTPITSAQVIELPYFHVHINSGRRVALAATFDIDGVPVTAYAVHLDNRLNVRDRRKQMMPVLQHAARHATPTIVAGDFNTSPFTWISHVVPVLTTTQDNHFEKLMRSHGFATPVKDSGPTFRYIGMRLDGIYTRGFDTLRFATADAANISDHLALWAEVRARSGATTATATAASVATR